MIHHWKVPTSNIPDSFAVSTLPVLLSTTAHPSTPEIVEGHVTTPIPADGSVPAAATPSLTATETSFVSFSDFSFKEALGTRYRADTDSLVLGRGKSALVIRGHDDEANRVVNIKGSKQVEDGRNLSMREFKIMRHLERQREGPLGKANGLDKVVALVDSKVVGLTICEFRLLRHGALVELVGVDIVTDAQAGESLWSIIERKGPLTAALAWRYGLDMVQGVDVSTSMSGRMHCG